jgi:hypothetical protein
VFKSSQTQAYARVPGLEPPEGTNAMAEYRIYVIGSDGHSSGQSIWTAPTTKRPSNPQGSSLAIRALSFGRAAGT